jgi:hypothetical protein
VTPDAIVRRLSEANVGSKPEPQRIGVISAVMTTMEIQGLIGSWSVQRKNRSRLVTVGWSISASNPTSWVDVDMDTLTPESILVMDVMGS